jgi:hypothetical protein
MIIFGTRGKTIAGSNRRGIACSACGQEEHAAYGNLRYFHLFFIPMFPIRREPVLQCRHCRKTLVGGEIPEPARGEIVRQVFTGKRTAPMFIGTAIAVVLALFIVVVGGGESRKQVEYLRNPLPGDYYVVKAADLATSANPQQPYAILQVAAVSADQVELRVGRQGYLSSLRALKAIRNKEPSSAGYFASAPIKLPMDTLPSLKSKGTIDSVKRP